MKKGEPGYTLHVFGVTLLVLAPALFLYAWQSRGTLRDFQKNGQPASARVLGKSRAKPMVTRFFKSPTDYRVKVSFRTASLLQGGKLVFAEVRDFVRPSVWLSLKNGDQVEVLFLPHRPEKALLASSLQSASFAPAERYEFALGVLMLGVFLVLLVRLKNRRTYEPNNP